MSELINTENTEIGTNISIEDLKAVLLENSFDDNILALRNEITELSTVYDRIKRHTMHQMDLIDNENPTPRRMNAAQEKKLNPLYLSSQVSNLISLKNLQTSMLKEVSNLQQSKLDRATKLIGQIIKTEAELRNNGGSTNDLPKEAIFKLLMGMNITIPISSSEKDLVAQPTLYENESEDDIDKMLEAKIKSENISTIDVNIKPTLINEKSVETEIDNEPIPFNTLDEELEDNGIESDNLEDQYIIYIDIENEKYYKILERDGMEEIVEELSEDSIEITQSDDNEYYCSNHNLPIKFSSEPEFE